MHSAEIEVLLLETRDPDPTKRRTAVRELCPCHLRANNDVVWDRILELVKDPDPGVRRLVFHTMIDGSPRSREREVLAAVESLRNDESPKLRRQVRKLLADYHRTGRVNVEGA